MIWRTRCLTAGWRRGCSSTLLKHLSEHILDGPVQAFSFDTGQCLSIRCKFIGQPQRESFRHGYMTKRNHDEEGMSRDDGRAREENRTPDLLITSELLCRLSYPGGPWEPT